MTEAKIEHFPKWGDASALTSVQRGARRGERSDPIAAPPKLRVVLATPLKHFPTDPNEQLLSLPKAIGRALRELASRQDEAFRAEADKYVFEWMAAVGGLCHARIDLVHEALEGGADWIDRDTLAVLVPKWIEALGTIRNLALPHDRWVAEMIGYSLAASDLGLYHSEVMLSCGPSLFHYYIGHCGLQWDKASYEPWTPLPPINPDAPAVVQAFGRLLDEYAALRRGTA